MTAAHLVNMNDEKTPRSVSNWKTTDGGRTSGSMKKVSKIIFPLKRRPQV
jgi:hypothetical protein